MSGDLRLRPVTIADVRRFVAKHHRHSPPPMTWKFGVGVETDDGELVGVGSAGLPKARVLMTMHTLEVNRTCTNGHRNANSMIYGALARAAKALGYHRLITYTLTEEGGASLRAAGWTIDDDSAGSSVSWEARRGTGTQVDMFGAVRLPLGQKSRWVKRLR